MATIITTTLAAGSTASPFFYNVKIAKRLCKKTCVSKTPVFSPSFSLVGYKLVGTNKYEVTINVQGIISYEPCGSCCNKSQSVNENVVIPLYYSTEFTGITISGFLVSDSVKSSGCSPCGNQFVADCGLNITLVS